MRAFPWLFCFAVLGGYLYHNSRAPLGSFMYAVVGTLALLCIKILYMSKPRRHSAVTRSIRPN